MADVFIVGAGPSGLVMAAELLRHGLTCRIIDKSPTPSEYSKAIGVQARTLEMLTSLGVVDACIENGLKILHFIPNSNHKRLADIPLGLIESPFPFILSLEQSKFEAILIQHLEKLGCQVERQIELLDCKQDDQKVTLTLRNNITGDIVSSETQWLIGCDGAPRTVRKLMKLEFEGISLTQIFSLADIEIEWKYPRDSVVTFLSEKGLLAAIPIKGENRVRLILQLAREQNFLKENNNLGHGEIPSNILKKPTVEEITQVVNEYADAQAIVKNPVWMTNFSINSRMVSRYQVNRVFLVGDAAHIHSPVGGQGMNTGIQDGFNLGWKLALVHKGIAKSSLLESYHDERHLVGKNILYGTEKATKFVLVRSPMLFYLRNLLITFVGSFTWFQRKIVNTLSEISISYPLSSWIIQKKSRALKLKPGMRAPDALVSHLGEKSSFFNLWKNILNFKLLVYSANQLTESDCTEFENLKNKYKDLITVYFVKSVSESADVCIEDFQDDIKRLYGDSTIYLIRPDGYICFCGPFPSLEGLDEYFNHLVVT